MIKIGDFGLVTNTLDHNCDKDSKSPKHARHTNQVGTQLYMSPEQVKPIDSIRNSVFPIIMIFQIIKKPYNHKVDIYSMGIIFYELLTPFNTEMERIVNLQNAREKKFSSEFKKNNREEVSLTKEIVIQL